MAYAQTPPPGFEDSSTRRQKVRAAGLHPDYWYPVEHDRKIKKGQVVEVKFWKRSYALFRGEDGLLRAIEDRCVHRQLKLSIGTVEGCELVCAYHGWAYNGDGALTRVKHDLFGKTMPNYKVESVPVRVRYGLIWIFPGNPEMASKRHIPEIPELEGKDRWGCVPVDFTWKAHHSMIIDNVSDFTHAWLHRRYRPFDGATLTRLETVGDNVHVSYDTQVGRGKISGLFVDRKAVNTNAMDLCYEYPYQWSNTDDKIKHWCFVLPIDEQTTRSFFLFYFKSFKIPMLPLTLPKVLMTPLLKVASRTLVKPLLSEDGVAVQAEQAGWEAHWDETAAELNPCIRQFQNVTIRKWEEHLAAKAATGHTARKIDAA